MFRRARLLAPVLLVGALFAACGGDDADAGPPPTTPAEGAAASASAGTDAAEGAFPVTIDHANGSTTFDGAPERIVTLNVQWTDAVLAMGVDPVAYMLDATALETEPYPWQAEHIAGIARIDATGGVIPFEQIAAQRPDLILVTFAASDPAVYQQLQAIAPTIGMLGDLQVDTWQSQVEVLGDVLGRPDHAQDVIADVEGEVDALADELPGLAGKTYAAANYVEGDGIYVIADPDDGASLFFYRLGMEIDPDILALDTQAVGRVHLSLEQASLLDADFLGVLTNGSDPSVLPGWDQLRAVRDGSLVDFTFADVVGINTPTPLSVPYEVDLLRPSLAKIAAA